MSQAQATILRRWLAVLLCIAAAGLLAVAGCGDGRIATYPVWGTVMVNNQPADGAIVIFCPVDPNAELENLRPAGKADSSGRFSLTTFESGDGAPEGNYKVLVKWPAEARPDDREGRAGTMGPDRLRGRYYNIDKTPLTATIESQSNELPPFELKQG
jgi:hypothetical protein